MIKWLNLIRSIIRYHNFPRHIVTFRHSQGKKEPEKKRIRTRVGKNQWTLNCRERKRHNQYQSCACLSLQFYSFYLQGSNQFFLRKVVQNTSTHTNLAPLHITWMVKVKKFIISLPLWRNFFPSFLHHFTSHNIASHNLQKNIRNNCTTCQSDFSKLDYPPHLSPSFFQRELHTKKLTFLIVSSHTFVHIRMVNPKKKL